MEGEGVDVKVHPGEGEEPTAEARGAAVGGREGVGTRLSSCPVVTLLSLQASSTLVPPVTLGSPARPHPSWQGSVVPSSVLLTWNPRGCPHKAPPLQNFTHQAKGVTDHPPRGPHKPSCSCHLLAMALQPGSTVLQAGPPLPEGGRSLAHLPSGTLQLLPLFSPSFTERQLTCNTV